MTEKIQFEFERQVLMTNPVIYMTDLTDHRIEARIFFWEIVC